MKLVFHIFIFILIFTVCISLYILTNSVSAIWLKIVLGVLAFSMNLLVLVYFVFLKNYAPLNIFNQGLIVEKKYATNDNILSIPNLRVVAKKNNELLFSIEDLMSEPNGNASWRLHIYFTIYNNCSFELNIFDFHTHVYCSEAFHAPPGDILRRYYIEIYETNSILAGGKTYSIKPKEHLSVDIAFDITRKEGYGDNIESKEGMVLSIFGLFADYSFILNNEIKKKRVPVEAIYSFQNSINGHFIYINEKNIQYYWEKHKSSASGRTLVNAFRKALKIHLSKEFDLL
jgi:hypothetical protein